MTDIPIVLRLSVRVFSPCVRYLARPGWIPTRVRKSAISGISWWYSVAAR